MLNLTELKLSLIDCYNDDCVSVGRKYLIINENQFANKFLRGVALENSQLNDYLRVYTGGFEVRQEVIEINEH